MRRISATGRPGRQLWAGALLASGLLLGSLNMTIAEEVEGDARPQTLAERRELARQASEDQATAKRSAAKAAKTSAKTRARSGSGASASASASVSSGRGFSAMGTGRTCGPAPFNSTSGAANSAGAGFALSALASIGVGGAYSPTTATAAASTTGSVGRSSQGGGGHHGGSRHGGGAMAGGAVDVCVKANVTLDDGTSVDVRVRVRVRPGDTTPVDPSEESSSSTTTDSLATAGSALDAKIVEFAQNHIDQQVGNGECWTLAAEALKYADAEPPQLYVFGREVPTPEVRPGHILQFESARFEGDGYFLVLGAPNHTAIVTAVRGAKLTILHQNVNGSRVVQTGELNVDELVSGRMIVYAALPKNSRNSSSGQ
jgi:hypothetical protein